MNCKKTCYCIFFLCFVSFSCTRQQDQGDLNLFSLLPADSTGIHFINHIVEDEEVNPLQYENSYNGGGVAIGDVNNDGLDDIYFTGNRSGNKLYLNKGNFHFIDVTTEAQVGGRSNSWCTGVTMADVNGDGLLDIYVCHSGNVPGTQRANELFLNVGSGANGLPNFKEFAAALGLADFAFSNQAAFLDYDRDGDLDMVLLNHSPVRFNNLDETAINYLINKTDLLTGIKFFTNNQGIYKETTQKSGLKSSRLNFNLGVSVADVNNDGWPDLYISNDYFAPDYLYINQKNGSFKDELGNQISCTSQFSMGNDVADINNDGLADIYTLDMLPEDNRRQKLLFGGDNFEHFAMTEKAGLNAQYMRNMLHLNNGNGNFSEIAQLANVSNTDWSWAPLLADLDNDGWKDIFVTNGYLRDYTNMDFLKYMGDYLRDNEGQVQKNILLNLVKKMPSSEVKNYAFKNNRQLSFTNEAKKWGLDAISNSSGAAYSDLDNDGDLDLVVNNINAPAFVYKNNVTAQHFVRVKLVGGDANIFGTGARVQLFAGGLQQVQEQSPTRGFQSSVSPVLVFGTGNVATFNSLVITWPLGKRQLVAGQACNTTLVLREADALPVQLQKKDNTPLFTALVKSPLSYTSLQPMAYDFKRQPLLINALSYNGPAMAKADINNDGLDDIFIGGAAGSAGSLFIQHSNGSFVLLPQPDFVTDAGSDDAKAVFFDANNDGSIDLFVASGGYYFFNPGDEKLESRLYLNDGNGHFKRSYTVPKILTSVGAAAAADVNGDGFSDLFLGGKVIPGNYPVAPRSYILLNNGQGVFRDATVEVCPALETAGMFTDAVFADLDGDNINELITAGEWMPVQVWKNKAGKLQNATSDYLPGSQTGWWNALSVQDLNNDGKPDIVAGNNGLNTQWKASEKQPVELLYKDFDDNGSIDPIFSYYIQGKSYPYVSRDELLDQMSSMRTRFTDYKSYANATINEVFTPEELKDAKKLAATSLQTMAWLSSSSQKFNAVALPVQAQFSPVYAISIHDFNNDGHPDILLGGNTQYSRVKMGVNQSNPGQLFLGNGKSFTYVRQPVSGLHITGNVRSFCIIGNTLYAGINGKPVQAYKIGR